VRQLHHPDEKIQQIQQSNPSEASNWYLWQRHGDMESNVQSELHHWVRRDLERRVELSQEER
jgi:hypothetical protein